jgi:hypothetical protein
MASTSATLSVEAKDKIAAKDDELPNRPPALIASELRRFRARARGRDGKCR